MLCWGLAVVGTPLRWTLGGVAASLAYIAIIDGLMRFHERRAKRVFGWVALISWALILISSLPELSAGSVSVVAETIALRFFGWAWIVLPLAIAESGTINRRGTGAWFPAWLLGLALTFTLAVMIGPSTGADKVILGAAWTSASIVVLGGAPFGFASLLIRVGSQRASVEVASDKLAGSRRS